jgi:Flp pilus assembly protein TadD
MPRDTVSDRALVGALALVLGLAASISAVAQPVVQAVPGAQNRGLNAALARLAANPRDGGALIDAGNAALAMNDIDAAIGFFTRAEQVVPGDPRAKAGLAGAYVRNEDPFTAIRLFNEAELQGPLPSALLADRGLAYDLVGDNPTAQRIYRQAGPYNDEATRRLALSLAISGDLRGSEAALSPLLTRQDKSAWRVRAFSLAIRGEQTQAVSIANATMPATLAAGIAPYLRYMPQLTRAQQAAAGTSAGSRALRRSATTTLGLPNTRRHRRGGWLPAPTRAWSPQASHWVAAERGRAAPCKRQSILRVRRSLRGANGGPKSAPPARRRPRSRSASPCRRVRRETTGTASANVRPSQWSRSRPPLRRRASWPRRGSPWFRLALSRPRRRPASPSSRPRHPCRNRQFQRHPAPCSPGRAST